MSGMQWHRIFGGGAAEASRPQDLSGPVRELRRQGADHRSQQLRRHPAVRSILIREGLDGRRRATNSMLYSAQGSIGARIMDVVTLVIFAGFIASAYVVGRMAERRGRSFKNWAVLAAVLIGPLAIPLLFLFPSLRGKNGGAA
jgi:hypothetical protein